MNKYKLISIIFLISISLFAQNEPTKSTIQKIIRSSQVEMKNGKFSLPSNKSWEFNNIDSLYFKQDTLTALVYKSSKHKSLCELVDWTFYRKNAFILGQESHCKEPPSRKVTQHLKDYFTIAIYRVENETIMDVLSFDKMIVESFKILNVIESQEFTEIKLYRRFNAN
jgi:hypothetical protein